SKGDVVPANWLDPDVKSSLDLCLSCKGCKSDCPVAVDVATYKAEFLSHYYEGRVHPLGHYAFARVDLWARLGSVAPGIANFLTQAPVLGDAAKFAGGISARRKVPRLAKQTFTQRFAKRQSRSSAGGEVLLWPDTFNNYFHPETSIAAVEVLERSGFRVRIPTKRVCCGRPLYDFGMLGMAKKYLLRVFDVLQ